MRINEGKIIKPMDERSEIDFPKDEKNQRKLECEEIARLKKNAKYTIVREYKYGHKGRVRND